MALELFGPAADEVVELAFHLAEAEVRVAEDGHHVAVDFLHCGCRHGGRCKQTDPDVRVNLGKAQFAHCGHIGVGAGARLAAALYPARRLLALTGRKFTDALAEGVKPPDSG